MVEQSSRCGDDHVGPHFQSALLARKFRAVGAAVYGEGADRQEIGKAFHLPVDLLHKLAGRSHDDAVDCVVGQVSVGDAVDYREKVGGGFAGSGLGAGHEVVSVEDYRDSLFLNGSALVKCHCVKGIEHIITEVKVFKFHRVVWLSRGGIESSRLQDLEMKPWTMQNY